ncbi:MAG: hypothetical protein R2728_09735 [Chitinophagales bacterium]
MRKENTGKAHHQRFSDGRKISSLSQDRHPHTNMASTALNMMTHTSASDFAKDGIYMNAVDTGWVTDEDPMNWPKAKEKFTTSSRR